MRNAVTLLIALAITTVLGDANAQTWSPTQPIRVIIPYAPVGTSDIIARIMAERVRERLGQPFVLENKPGGSTQIGTELVARAKPDGHTLLLVANTFAVNPSLFPKLPYDSLKDFTAITYTGVTPHVLAVNPSLPVKTVKELIDYARARPGKLSYGSVGNGTSFHLGMEQLKKLSETFMVHIPYRGMGPVITDLLANEVQVAFVNPPNVLGFVQSGRLRALGTAHNTRLAQFPDVPTIAEQGYAGFESNSWFVMFAPSATPTPILDRLEREFIAILKEPAVFQALTAQGVEVMALPRAATTAFVRKEMVKYAEVVKFSGAKVD